MTSIKTAARILLLIPLLLVFAACGGGGGAPPVLVSIAVTPANSTFVAGTVVHYIATGTYSNGTRLDITGLATWSSSNTGVVTVSDASGSKGTATAVAAGTAQITATVGTLTGNITASTTVTVTDSGQVTGENVMTITVNGSLCSAATSAMYFNKPCVSVTVCNPGSNTVCQTVNDILLDTGSYGLRIFASTIPNLTLTQIASGTGSLAGCARFADGSSLWGPIMSANVQLGGEPAVQIPVQVINSSFGTRPAGCSNADPTPTSAGFNGILGVGLFPNDCGPLCASDATVGIYYSCTGSSCTQTVVPVSNQVANPVASLPLDNNGIQVQLPAVPTGVGVASITGKLVMGIGTQGNNGAGTVTVLPTDSSGDFTTTFGTFSGDGFLDTGSNAYFIPNVIPSVLPTCPSPNAAWYCPPVTRALFASVTGAGGSPTLNVPFNISNFLLLISTGNKVFSDVGGTSTFGFDWGLPFFMGRNVFLGFDQRFAPSLGTGPLVGFNPTPTSP